MPIKIENPTRPSRYSFFQGLKKVLSIKGSEKTPKKALFKEAKNLKIFRGASKYQNFKKIRGNLIKFMDSLPFRSFLVLRSLDEGGTRRRVLLV
jgi:hypothetical protein